MPALRMRFPNLDALRFLAFLSVFLFHALLYNDTGTSSSSVYAALYWLTRFGFLGVNFFFVLSGFLVTYLLLQEKDQAGKINVGRFYLRRALRIWPLYYLLVIFCFFIFPVLRQVFGTLPHPETAHLVCYIFFVSNFENIKILTETSALYVLWSVSIEEQFYLVWPLLLRLKLRPGIWPIFPVVILISIISRAILYPSQSQLYFNTLAVIGDMATGGWLAWSVFSKNRVYHVLLQCKSTHIIIVYVAGIILVLFQLRPPGLLPEVIIFERFLLALFFAFVIFEQVFSSNSLFKAGRWRMFSSLGRVSYGLYCYHMLCLLVMYKLTQQLGGPVMTGMAKAVIRIFGSLLLTIAVAYMSYYFWERPFLKLKPEAQFETNETGNSLSRIK